MTVEQLWQEFKVNYVENRLRASTQRGYETNVRLHLLPHYGIVDISSIVVDDLDELTRKLKPNLCNKSIVYVHATFRKMLNYARRREYIQKNPYDLFDAPRVDKYNYRTFSEEEISRLLYIVKGTELEVPVVFALCYGLRRGECLGIIPAIDLDYKKRILHIQRTRSIEHGESVVTPCKTEKSNRKILLTEEHAGLLLSKMVGKNYACPLSPNQVEHRYKMLLVKNGFPNVRFHDMRHSFATLMLEKGINPKIVSTVLGHSGIGVTLDLYSHPDINLQEVCIQVISRL